MTRSLRLSAAALAVLAVLAVPSLAQTPKKADVVGTWTGPAVVSDDGNTVDIIVVIDKAEGGYSGKLSDTSGLVPESPLRKIEFKDNKLSFEFDLAQGMDTTLIKIELALEADTLKGAWSDPDGNTGAISLTLKK
jgi:hypothetical protein